MLVLYLQGDLVELCEGEDGLLHHVDALVPQQHVQVGHQTQQQLVVTLTGGNDNNGPITNQRLSTSGKVVADTNH